MDAIDYLYRILEGLDGPATRERLQQERSKIERSFQAEQAPQPTQGDTRDPAPHAELDSKKTTPADAVAATVGDSATATAGNGAGVPITALLLTPSHKHALQLDKNYAAEPECLRLGHEVADDAILIAVAKARDLFAVVRSVEWWKFKRCHSVYQLSRQEGPDMTEALVMAIFLRGEFKPIEPMVRWPRAKDPVRLAERLLQSVEGRRVHLFAEKRSPGWEAIVGDENWVTAESAP